MIAAKLNEVFQIGAFSLKQFNEVFPELGVVVECQAVAGEIKEILVGHEGVMSDE